jgi:SAM-dependent methyltransferase
MATDDQLYWNNRWNYLKSSAPWEIYEADSTLMEFFELLQVENMLEIGCGSGTNAIWASERASHVTAIDIANLAINLAVSKPHNPNLQFLKVDFFEFSKDRDYDFIFDRGCFHGIQSESDRCRFADKISSVITDNGHWLSIVGSAEDIDSNQGPPRRTLTEVVSSIEPYMKITQIKECKLKNNNGIFSPAWAIISSKRTIALNPSLEREQFF